MNFIKLVRNFVYVNTHDALKLSLIALNLKLSTMN